MGFCGFARSVQQAAPPDPFPEADAIVALTGGSTDRLTTAMGLLGSGHGRRLLISGVNPKVTDKEMAALLHGGDKLFKCCVDVGRRAEDTLGNAAETAAWARQNDLHTIIVVTAGYHMARALRQIARELPDVELRAVPVRSPALRSRDDLPTMRLLANEYDKLLAVWSGFNRLMTKGSKP